jgi:hypothetical protein
VIGKDSQKAITFCALENFFRSHGGLAARRFGSFLADFAAAVVGPRFPIMKLTLFLTSQPVTFTGSPMIFSLRRLDAVALPAH